jgi:YD repeat-containing protein
MKTCWMHALRISIATALLATSFDAVPADTETYNYDVYGRLRVVTYTSGKQTSYNFDAAGNRTNDATTTPAPITDTATMTQGTFTGGVTSFFGLLSGSAGSISPAALTGGKTVTNFYDRKQSGVFAETKVGISGFTSDPGPAWLVSVTAKGQTRNAASASYTYSGGQAFWTWSAPANSAIGFTSSGTTSCTFVHN